MDNNILKYFEFIYDRQMISYKRHTLKEPAPWTTDRVLAENRFCEILREKDKSTIYLIEKVLTSNISNEDKVLNTLFFRYFNTYRVFEDVFDGELLSVKTYDQVEVYNTLDKKKNEGIQLYRPAYLIGSMGKNASPHGKHHDISYSLQLDVNNLNNGLLERLQNDDPAVVFKLLLGRQRGNFLAYEVFCDLGYTGIIPHSDNSFVNIGPGAYWGLSLMFGEFHWKKAEGLCYKLRDCQEEAWKILKEEHGKDWFEIAPKQGTTYSPTSPLLSIRGIEHSLCEYRKYLNISRSLIDPSFKCRRRKY